VTAAAFKATPISGGNFTLPEAENYLAPQRRTATSIATINSNPE
jgi:hypothetical protein